MFGYLVYFGSTANRGRVCTQWNLTCVILCGFTVVGLDIVRRFLGGNHSDAAQVLPK